MQDTFRVKCRFYAANARSLLPANEYDLETNREHFLSNAKTEPSSRN
jgi:hypothetical protein